MKKIAYLSLGSNVGDRRANLRTAIGKLLNLGNLVDVSSFYETEPVEFTEQPWFINCVVALQTNLSAEEFLKQVLAIEGEMGRTRTRPKGPRIIDLDILLFGDAHLNTPQLTIPHPAMHQRRFVLEPLAEIAPDAKHPILKKTAREMLKQLPRDSGKVEKAAAKLNRALPGARGAAFRVRLDGRGDRPPVFAVCIASRALHSIKSTSVNPCLRGRLKQIVAIYPGSFDPVTNGHLDLIRRGSKLFDELIVAIARNPDKDEALFDLAERTEMLQAMTADLENVSVDSFEGLLVSYCVVQECQRGAARNSGGERLRVRVADGADEPQDGSAGGDDFHASRRKILVSEFAHRA